MMASQHSRADAPSRLRALASAGMKITCHWGVPCTIGITASVYASDVSPELNTQLAHVSMTAGRMIRSVCPPVTAGA